MNKFIVVVSSALLLLTSCSSSKPEVSPEQKDVPKNSGNGTISGKVSFSGEKPKRKDIRGQMEAVPSCLKQHSGPIYSEDVVIDGTGGLKNVFVRVKDGLPNQTWQVPETAVSIDQKGCVYSPHVVGAMVNQNVEFSNSDTVNHNIHPFPRNNREWNESQPPQGDKKIKTFLKEEIMVPIKCNVHPWMRVFVGVSSHPFFAVTGEDGTFTIKRLPAGEYTLEAWHEQFGIQEVKVKIGENESVAAAFTFK